MEILICCATPGELKAVKTEIKKLNFKRKLEIHYLCTGIGNYETIYTLTKYLTETKNKDFFIINIGICGYRGFNNQILEKSIQIGRIKNLSTNKEILVPIFFEFGKIKSIFSSENIVFTPPNHENSGYIDMESRAIEYCANKFKVPRLILKVPYDKIGKETKNFNKSEACNILSKNINYKELLNRILPI